MRFLFIVQGEGRGHMTQAISMHDILVRNGHEVVEILIGKKSFARYSAIVFMIKSKPSAYLRKSELSNITEQQRDSGLQINPFKFKTQQNLFSKYCVINPESMNEAGRGG